MLFSKMSCLMPPAGFMITKNFGSVRGRQIVFSQFGTEDKVLHLHCNVFM